MRRVVASLHEMHGAFTKVFRLCSDKNPKCRESQEVLKTQKSPARRKPGGAEF
ncbi:hypothetical protein M2322_003140 [Rhodoblastus acidophilus]|nr:hypothetical protein [Rhodoblastus acidophilus]